MPQDRLYRMPILLEKYGQMTESAPLMIMKQRLHMDAKLLPDSQNYWIPNSYEEVMTCSHIWGDPIQKELGVMRKLRVWTVIDHPEGSRLFKTC